MKADKESLIVDLVNKGLDGDMDSVNACEDRIIRGKAKAMIMKVKKGVIDRPELPKPVSSQLAGAGNDSQSLTKDEKINLLVNKGLDGDMDSVNACEDRIIRGKAKAMIMKVKKGAIDRPPMPSGLLSMSKDSENQVEEKEKEKSTVDKVKQLLDDMFPNQIIPKSDSDYIQLSPEKWFDIASWLKSDASLLFDSLQCQTGLDIGDEMLESRYNLHSMQKNHYCEFRIAVPRSNPRIPSVEQIWRIADWFERETYDMFGIEFEGHRDLRRILLPEDWEGWPLRKDYQEQETYHGIVIPKVKEGWE